MHAKPRLPIFLQKKCCAHFHSNECSLFYDTIQSISQILEKLWTFFMKKKHNLLQKSSEWVQCGPCSTNYLERASKIIKAIILKIRKIIVIWYQKELDTAYAWINLASKEPRDFWKKDKSMSIKKSTKCTLISPALSFQKWQAKQ